jgi:hypothetical protein
MAEFREPFGEPIVFLEIAPTKELTEMRASFSLGGEEVRSIISASYDPDADGRDQIVNIKGV